MKETIHFYENIIGLKKTAEWPNYVTFDAGGFDLAFELGGKKGGKISHKEGAPDLFMEVDDVDDVYRKLKENGVKFVSEPKDQTWSARTATFLDLDENRFILVHLKRARIVFCYLQVVSLRDPQVVHIIALNVLSIEYCLSCLVTFTVPETSSIVESCSVRSPPAIG